MKEFSFGRLIGALLDGDHAAAVAAVRKSCAAGVDPEMVVTAGMALGYPDEEPEARARKNLSELVYWNNYV